MCRVGNDHIRPGNPTWDHTWPWIVFARGYHPIFMDKEWGIPLYRNFRPIGAELRTERLRAAADKSQRETADSRRTRQAPDARRRSNAAPRRRFGIDIDLPSGGGALDPLTALLGLGLAALGGATIRRKRKG